MVNCRKMFMACFTDQLKFTLIKIVKDPKYNFKNHIAEYLKFLL